MSSTFSNHHQNFLPATDLARKFSYTSDYISKLARDGKIAAIRDGRRWLINENSLNNFLIQTSQEKILRKNSLRIERIQERQKYLEMRAVVAASSLNLSVPNPFDAFIKAVLIMACGSMAGMIGFVVHQENLNLNILESGLYEMVAQVESSVIPHSLSFVTDSVDQAALLSLSDFFSWFRFDFYQKNTHLTAVPKTEPAVNSSNGLILIDEKDVTPTTIADIKSSFSDEVEVTFEGEDYGLIKPVFKDASDESYKFLMVPVSNTRTE